MSEIVHARLLYLALSFRGIGTPRPDLALPDRMNTTSVLRRALRYDVNWSMRVRQVHENRWHTAKTVNLSVTGVLLQSRHNYHVGDRVEVEIDFFTQPHATTVIAGVGRVIREDRSESGTAAIQFFNECELARKCTPVDEWMAVEGVTARLL